jgi:hypothetical protein
VIKSLSVEMRFSYYLHILISAHPQMVFFRDISVGRHDLIPQNSTLLLRVRSKKLRLHP